MAAFAARTTMGALASKERVMKEQQKKKKKEKMMKPKAVIVDIDGTLFEEVPNWTQETDLD